LIKNLADPQRGGRRDKVTKDHELCSPILSPLRSESVSFVAERPNYVRLPVAFRSVAEKGQGNKVTRDIINTYLFIFLTQKPYEKVLHQTTARARRHDGGKHSLGSGLPQSVKDTR
jgi:hypothetical protein